MYHFNIVDRRKVKHTSWHAELKKDTQKGSPTCGNKKPSFHICKPYCNCSISCSRDRDQFRIPSSQPDAPDGDTNRVITIDTLPSQKSHQDANSNVQPIQPIQASHKSESLKQVHYNDEVQSRQQAQSAQEEEASHMMMLQRPPKKNQKEKTCMLHLHR